MVPCMPSNSNHNHSHLRSLLLCPFGGMRDVSGEFLALLEPWHMFWIACMQHPEVICSFQVHVLEWLGQHPLHWPHESGWQEHLYHLHHRQAGLAQCADHRLWEWPAVVGWCSPRHNWVSLKLQCCWSVCVCVCVCVHPSILSICPSTHLAVHSLLCLPVHTFIQKNTKKYHFWMSEIDHQNILQQQCLNENKPHRDCLRALMTAFAAQHSHRETV